MSVRPSEVQASAAELSPTQSAATARHSLGVLRRVFDYAVRDGVIPRNPATRIRLSKVQGNDPRPLTHDEPWRLAGQLDGARDRLLVLVDPPFTREQVQRVGGWVEHSGRRLAYIYATHGRVHQ